MRWATHSFRVNAFLLAVGCLLLSHQAVGAAELAEPVSEPPSFFRYLLVSNGIIFGPLMLFLAVTLAGIIVYLALAMRRGRIASELAASSPSAGWARQERMIRWLGALGLLSPMLGLLGTVLGVMVLGMHGAVPEGMMATCVSHALSVLFEGLFLACIAVPAYVLFKNRLQRLRLAGG